MKRISLHCLGTLLIATALLASCRNSLPAQIGTQAPDFTVTNPDRTVTLSQFRGKPVILNFWATWCAPCVEEVPSLVQLQKQMGNKVILLAISTDVDDGAYRHFVQKNMPGVLTIRDGENKSNNLYGTFAFPETYIIDRSGKIQRKLIGAQNWTSPEIIDYLNKF